MVYATVAKGYRIGGANPLFPVSACTEITVEPDSYNSDTVIELRSWHQGQVLRRPAAGSGSVYYLKWNNIQQTTTCRPAASTTPPTRAAREQGLRPAGRVAGRPTSSISISALATPMRYYTSTSAIRPDCVLADHGRQAAGLAVDLLARRAIQRRRCLGTDSFIRARLRICRPRNRPDAGTRSAARRSFDPRTGARSGDQPCVTLRAGMTFGNINVALFVDNLLTRIRSSI